jgi:ABC-type multidrug transport system ATPase subunit
MLELHNVSKVFGRDVRAVDGINLSLSSGLLGLIGHNGAGKTTLMQMIATLTRPTSGTIRFDGEDIVRRPDAIRRRLGYLPQDFGIYPNLSALEFMQYFAALKGVREQGGASAGRIRELLELVNLTDHAHRPAASFSGGMRRRLGIAQALLNDPDILVVDEPTAGLDPEERLRFRKLLSDLGMRKLVIMSTHIVSDIENVAGLLAIMRRGQLVACEAPDTILDKARGQVWTAAIDPGEYESLSARVQVLQAQRQGNAMQLRIAHPVSPCGGAALVEPSLEEALMAQRYAVQEAA